MKVTLGTKEGLSAVELSMEGTALGIQDCPSLSSKGDWTGNQGRTPDRDWISTANPKCGQT